MKRFLSVACVLFFLSALLAFPQSSFLKRGQSGFGLSGTYATSSGASGWSGTAAVVAGFTIFRFSVGRLSNDPVSSGFNDLALTSSCPRSWRCHQTESVEVPRFPFDLGRLREGQLFLAGPRRREVHHVGEHDLRRRDGLSGRSVVAGLYLQPMPGSATKGRVEIRNADGLTRSGRTDLACWASACPSFTVLLERCSSSARLTFDDDNVTFAISVGLVIALKKPAAREKTLLDVEPRLRSRASILASARGNARTGYHILGAERPRMFGATNSARPGRRCPFLEGLVGVAVEDFRPYVGVVAGRVPAAENVAEVGRTVAGLIAGTSRSSPWHSRTGARRRRRDRCRVPGLSRIGAARVFAAMQPWSKRQLLLDLRDELGGDHLAGLVVFGVDGQEVGRAPCFMICDGARPSRGDGALRWRPCEKSVASEWPNSWKKVSTSSVERSAGRRPWAR